MISGKFSSIKKSLSASLGAMMAVVGLSRNTADAPKLAKKKKNWLEQELEVLKRVRANRYAPHQGEGEKARRRSQMARGILQPYDNTRTIKLRSAAASA